MNGIERQMRRTHGHTIGALEFLHLNKLMSRSLVIIRHQPYFNGFASRAAKGSTRSSFGYYSMIV
jgi:hypothetical protein